MKDYASIATQYAQDVVAGKIPSCRWTKLACQRHLDDLVKVDDPDFPYRFSPKKAAKICKFAELLPLGGRWAGQGLLKLQPWQLFILANVFGWIDKETKLRRFSTALLYVPRKNGKSFLSAVVGLYGLLLDGEAEAEIYAGATTFAQALKVWKPAAVMLRRSPGLKQLGLVLSKESITVPATESKFVPIQGQPLDGDSPSIALLDESHQWRNDFMLTAMESGMAARLQPLTWITTTAGFNLAGPAKLMQDDLQDILLGNKQDDKTFGIFYGLDPEDDYTTDEAILKANPNAGVSVSIAFIREQVQKSLRSPRLKTSVKTKHFNIWCNAGVEWIPAEKWAACGDPSLRIEDFEEDECVAAFDLAEVKDLTAYVLMFKRVIDSKDHYYLFPRFQLPEARINDPGASHYRQWHEGGYLDSVPGEINTHVELRQQIVEDASRFRVIEVAHDPARAWRLVSELTDDGLTLVPIKQTWRELSEPMRYFESMVIDGRLHHDNSPPMNWCIHNTVAKVRGGDNITPEKATADRKIDGTDAAIMAMARMMLKRAEKPKGLVYTGLRSV